MSLLLPFRSTNRIFTVFLALLVLFYIIGSVGTRDFTISKIKVL